MDTAPETTTDPGAVREKWRERAEQLNRLADLLGDLADSPGAGR